MLTSCASSGLAPEPSIQLPEIPADLKVCFARHVPAPPPGPLGKRQIFTLIKDLKASADDKDRCGMRLACWYEDVARGFADEKNRAAPALECQAVKGE